MSDESPVTTAPTNREQLGPFSKLIIDAREQLGLTERGLAAEITEAAYDLDHETSTVHGPAVWRWEHGTVARKDLRRWTAHVFTKHGLAITEADLNAAAKAQKNARRLRRQHATNQASDMKRRQFLLAGGVVAVSALRGSLLTHRASANTVESDLQLDRLGRDVTDAWRLRQTARYSDLGALLPRLLVNLRAATVQSSREADLRLLLPMTIHAHNAASSLLRRLGADELAAIAADRAVRCASDIADPLLEASASYRLANVLMSARKTDDAKELSLAAASCLEPHIKESSAHLAMWGGLLLTTAVAAARQQASPQAWDLLGRARTAAVWLGYDHVDLNTMFGPSHVAIHGVEVASDLGDSRAALEHGRFVDLDALPPELLERRFTLLINLAVAHQQQGDATTALGLLLKADNLAPEEIGVDHKAHELIRVLLAILPGRQPELRALARRVGLHD